MVGQWLLAGTWLPRSSTLRASAPSLSRLLLLLQPQITRASSCLTASLALPAAPVRFLVKAWRPGRPPVDPTDSQSGQLGGGGVRFQLTFEASCLFLPGLCGCPPALRIFLSSFKWRPISAGKPCQVWGGLAAGFSSSPAKYPGLIFQLLLVLLILLIPSSFHYWPSLVARQYVA